MKYLKTYEDYTIVYGPDICDKYIDYVETDYFNIDGGYEDEDDEPPNTTGRNDMTVKNKIKKAPLRWSAT